MTINSAIEPSNGSSVDARNTANLTDLGTERTSAPKSRARTYIHAFLHGRGLVGTVLVGIVILAALLAPFITPFAPDQQIPGANLESPSTAHWLGTDAVNRDIFSRTLYGIRVNLLIVFLAVPIGAIIGAALGLIATTWSWTDTVLQRTFDVILAFPSIILGIALAVIVGPGIGSVFVVVVLAEIPIFGRLMRTQSMKVRELPYVETAFTIGANKWWIIRRHILPNSLDPLLVQLTLAMSLGVFIEGAMSFLGLGVVPPTPSLGSLINEGAAYAYHAPFFGIGPLMIVIMLTLGLMLISQSLSRRIR